MTSHYFHHRDDFRCTRPSALAINMGPTCVDVSEESAFGT